MSYIAVGQGVEVVVVVGGDGRRDVAGGGGLQRQADFTTARGRDACKVSSRRGFWVVNFVKILLSRIWKRLDDDLNGMIASFFGTITFLSLLQNRDQVFNAFFLC